jgi:hypothetical protein
MAFNPLSEKGLPLEDQIRSWRELNVAPFDPDAVDPYTRCRVIVMNGIEVEALMFSHQFSRHTNDTELLQQLALSRYVDHQQQKVVNWLLPGWSSVLETTIAYEQVAVDLTAWLARHEKDDYLRQAYEFGLLEDFDHLYRYSNLYEMIEHRKAQKIVDQLTEVMPGRPTRAHHRHPIDNVRQNYDRNTADPFSKLHQMTLVAAEQQTLNFYANVGPQYMEPIARQLYQEIGLVEEEHVTHYESLGDGDATWFEQLLLHEYNECWLYYSFFEQESDPRIKSIWELHLQMEIGQLQAAAQLMRRYEERDPAELLPAEITEVMTFEPNKEYVREVLATQMDLTTLGTGFVRDLHERFVAMQEKLQGDGPPASDLVIDAHRERFDGADYRLEAAGPYPEEAEQRAEKQWGSL